MHKKAYIGSLLVIIVLMFLAFLIGQGEGPASGLHWSSFDSPISTPVPLNPTPTPSVPEETQLALKFVSEREKIPIEQLIVVNQYQLDYEMLEKSFWSVTLLDAEDAAGWYTVMVDLADGNVVDDVEAIEEAEQAARRARYGKLDPALFERLETVDPGDEVPVVVWVAGGSRRSDAELYAELAAKYPEAQVALEASGNPFDVHDLKLIREIENEYARLQQADASERVQPLVGYLEEQGFAVKALNGIPAIAAALPKDAIQDLVQRSDVGVVYLDEDSVRR